MEIQIEPMAREYIAKKDRNQAITIVIGERPGACCVTETIYPSVRLGIVKPYEMQNYHQTTVNNIAVYYLERLPRVYRRVTVKVEKLLFFKKLVAVGEP